MSFHTCRVIYHAANLENVTDGFTSHLKEFAQRIFIALGRIWTRELWSNGKHVITRPPRTANFTLLRSQINIYAPVPYILSCLTDCYMTSYGLSHMSCTTTVMHKVTLLKIFFKSTLFQEKNNFRTYVEMYSPESKTFWAEAVGAHMIHILYFIQYLRKARLFRRDNHQCNNTD
jgi:hypothetical protein